MWIDLLVTQTVLYLDSCNPHNSLRLEFLIPILQMRKLRLKESKSYLLNYLSSALKLHISFDPTIPGLGIYPKEIIRGMIKDCSWEIYFTEKIDAILMSNNWETARLGHTI